MAHEILALQIVEVLLGEPTDDSVEIAVTFVKDVGQMLEETSPRGLRAIFERFRGILHEGVIDKRVQYTIEGLFAVRKSNFVDFPAVPEALDLVEKVRYSLSSSITHPPTYSLPPEFNHPPTYSIYLYPNRRIRSPLRWVWMTRSTRRR